MKYVRTISWYRKVTVVYLNGEKWTYNAMRQWKERRTAWWEKLAMDLDCYYKPGEIRDPVHLVHNGFLFENIEGDTVFIPSSAIMNLQMDEIETQIGPMPVGVEPERPWPRALAKR